MSDPTPILDTINRYAQTFTSGDRDAWLDCFTADATMEDPVGTPLKRGRDEIGAFYDQSKGSADGVELRLGADPVVCGSQAAFVLDIVVSLGDSKLGLNAIDVMTFDDDGRIASQRAFVDFSKLAPLDS
ncbi:MAG TPA: nuclear transport factor 2 family protein [Acidimicrobiales bacterium]|jgi:steroid delta-isomerase|nr:nuclear transport factor 2 family protein [Acidimicrobiales bacterium]